MSKNLILILSLLIFIFTGCAPIPNTGSGSGATPRATDVVSPPGPTDMQTPTLPSPAATPTRIAVDLTPAQKAALRNLSEKHGIPIDQIHLIKTEAMTWPTGCLGIVLPGVMCARGPVAGFKITLEANLHQYEIHTNQDGTSAIDAAQQLASIQFVTLVSDGSLLPVTPDIPLGPTYNPAFNALPPSGGATAGTAYVLDFSKQPNAFALDANGTRGLDFIKHPSNGLALWRGGPNVQPRLAWGTQPTASTPSALQASAVDGSGLQTLLTLSAANSATVQLVAEAWSADGQTLYFSKEPVGLGGYLVFGGASSLYQIHLSTRKVTELIPYDPSGGHAACLDAISADYRFVADHCTPQTITIRDLTGGAATTLQPPSAAAGFRLLGSANFSPDGKRLAFALAKGDPKAEQGWIAVSDGTRGASKVLLTSPAGTYYTVNGWLDDQTLLVQSSNLSCNSSCSNQLWTVPLDGSAPVKVANGSFLTMMDNR